MKLMHGDCLELMASIPDGSVDMILCDLPYGTTACKWDSVIPFEPLWAHYRRIVTPVGAIVLTSSQPFTTALIASNLGEFKYCLVWEKSKPTGFINAKNAPLKKHEDIAVFSKGAAANNNPRRMSYYPQWLTPSGKKVRSKNDSSGAWGSRPSRSNDGYVQEFTGYPTSILTVASEGSTVHPTQKPVALMEYLIRTYTNEGETVMDNCMGSGTTGVACANTGRNFIGIEQDAKYFAIAKQRIESARLPLLEAA